MPSVAQNEAVWGHESVWDRGGDEWSDPFGGTSALWYGMLEPRIGHLLRGRGVEIAPGYGRITARMLPLVDHLTAVDLNQVCVDACSERFADAEHFEVFKNDGRSLGMVPDNSADFVVSFDALVHVDIDVMRAYLTEVARVLKPDGVAFVHHSNAGSYLNPIGRFLGNGARARVSARTNHNWRGVDVCSTLIRDHAHSLGLKMNVAERITWHSKLLNDCFSLFSFGGSEATFTNYKFFDRPRATSDVLAAYRAVRG